MTASMTTTLAATPGPSARITITGIVGAASVQIFRGDGSTETRVAGDDLQIPAGAVFITDYRLPPGRTVSYRAVLYSALGVVVETVTATPLVVPAIEQGMAWVMDPEDPTYAMLLPLMLGTDAEVGHDTSGVAVKPLQGLPLWLGGPRLLLTRPFEIKTSTAAETTQFDRMVTPGGSLLIRPGAAFRHASGLVYIGAPAISEQPRHPYEGPARWVFTATEVADDGWPTVVVERTWLDVEAAYADWIAVEAAYATWLAVEQG